MSESKLRVNSNDSIESIHLNENEEVKETKTNPIKCKQNNFFSNKRQRDQLRELSKSPQINDVVKLVKNLKKDSNNEK